MEIGARLRRALLATLWIVVVACSPGADGLGSATTPEPVEATTESLLAKESLSTATPTVVPAPDNTATAVVLPTTAPVVPDTARTPAQDTWVSIEVWFPREPESYEDFSKMFAVERSLDAVIHEDFKHRVTATLDHWAAGPNPREQSQGFLEPLVSYRVARGCGPAPFQLEFVGKNVIVYLCGSLRTAGVGADARILESFRQTLAAAGADEVALISEQGWRCVGGQNDDNPLSCIAGFTDSLGAGFRCPTATEPEPATIGVVDDWANVRSAPSLSAPLLGRIDRGAHVMIYAPRVQSSDGISWTIAQLPEHERCVFIASQFVVTRLGR